MSPAIKDQPCKETWASLKPHNRRLEGTRSPRRAPGQLISNHPRIPHSTCPETFLVDTPMVKRLVTLYSGRNQSSCRQCKRKSLSRCNQTEFFPNRELSPVRWKLDSSNLQVPHPHADQEFVKTLAPCPLREFSARPGTNNHFSRYRAFSLVYFGAEQVRNPNQMVRDSCRSPLFFSKYGQFVPVTIFRI